MFNQLILKNCNAGEVSLQKGAVPFREAEVAIQDFQAQQLADGIGLQEETVICIVKNMEEYSQV